MSTFTCPECKGEGEIPPLVGSGTVRCLVCRGTGDLVIASIFDIRDSQERIAAALEVIASDITERKERERATLVSQYRHLQAEVERTGERFTAAERALDSATGYRPELVARSQRAEQDMLKADEALCDFLAANPGIEEMVGES